MRTVLDASALLAMIFSEPGADIVAQVVSRAVMSAVNYCEVAARLYNDGMLEDEVGTKLATVGVEVVAFEREHALAAAALRTVTRHLGLSLGDRACLALARRLNLPAMTADRAWFELDIGVEVQVIR